MFLKFIKPASIVTTLISIHKTRTSVRLADSEMDSPKTIHFAENKFG